MAQRWQYDAWDAVVKSATGTIICRLHGIDGEDFTDPITTKKNGRLIETTPDLLEACKAALETLESFVYHPDADAPELDLYAQLREAIAKAEAE